MDGLWNKAGDRPVVPATSIITMRILSAAVLALFSLLPRAESTPVAGRPSVQSVSMNVSNRESSRDFFVRTLGFSEVEGRLECGREAIHLEARPDGRPLPKDTRSNDLWFQHLAIVVSDMDRAWAGLQAAGVRPISIGGPQTLPLSNPAAGGIRACYFQDADGHPLELIWYPAGKGQARWQDAHEKRVLGIDHTAIAVSNTERSLAFYRDILGFEVAGENLNFGPEQEALSGVAGARVRITGLRGSEGPGIEFLEYLHPRSGRALAADASPGDLLYWEISIRVPVLRETLNRLHKIGTIFLREEPTLAVVRDPDGHALRLIGD